MPPLAQYRIVKTIRINQVQGRFPSLSDSEVATISAMGMDAGAPHGQIPADMPEPRQFSDLRFLDHRQGPTSFVTLDRPVHPFRKMRPTTYRGRCSSDPGFNRRHVQ
jgi:hypothetical protein